MGPVALMLATEAAAAKKGARTADDAAIPLLSDESQGRAANFVNNERIRIRPEWMMGVPRVNGKFDCEQSKVWEPVFLLNENGGTTGDSLQDLFEFGVLPCYPNIAPRWTFGE